MGWWSGSHTFGAYYIPDMSKKEKPSDNSSLRTTLKKLLSAKLTNGYMRLAHHQSMPETSLDRYKMKVTTTTPHWEKVCESHNNVIHGNKIRSERGSPIRNLATGLTNWWVTCPSPGSIGTRHQLNGQPLSGDACAKMSSQLPSIVPTATGSSVTQKKAIMR